MNIQRGVFWSFLRFVLFIANDSLYEGHFINNELDQGPIIMQNVINVDHTYSADAMMRAGRDVEKTVLSRALDLALHDRIFVYKNKTVVL